jgi:membrane protease YdiL (CAAX protease family)
MIHSNPRNLGWIAVYITSVLCYIPYGISFSIGLVAAVRIVYPDADMRRKADMCALSPRLHLAWITVLCVFPMLVGLSSSLLPQSVNMTMSYMLADGPAFMCPGPLFVLPYVVPIVVIGCLYGWPTVRRCIMVDRRVCGVILLSTLCVLPLLLKWRDIGDSSVFPNPWRSVHLGVKSFYYNGVWEELYFRFLLILLFCGYCGKRISVLLAATVFTASHTSIVATCWAGHDLSALVSLLSLLLLGVSAGYCFCVTNSVIPCIMFHGVCSGSVLLVDGVGRLLLR